MEFPQHWIVPLGGRHADEVAVSNWLSGRNEPTLHNLLRLSTGRSGQQPLLLPDPFILPSWTRSRLGTELSG